MQLPLEQIKSFKTTIGTFKKVLITDTTTYYVNEKECDENGNTFMFDNEDGKMVANNHLASGDFLRALFEDKIEWISKSCYKNLKLMLENDYTLISDDVTIAEDPLERDEEAFTTYLCHEEKCFISIGHEDDYIIRHKVKVDIDKAKENITEWVARNYDGCSPQERDVFFEGSQLELIQVLDLNR